MPPQRTRRPALGFIFITLLIDVLGFGLIIPVAPRLVQEIQGGSLADAATAVGFLAATYAVMQFLFAPLLGVLSDRFGRRPVLLFSIFGSGIDFFAMAFAPSLAFLFITRMINGFTGASITVASAYVADVTPPEKRAAGFGMIGAAFGIGFVLGPLMGGILGEIDIRYPFYAAGALTLLNWLYGMFVLPESLPPERRRPITPARMNPVGAYVSLGRFPLVMGLAAAVFLFNLAQFSLHATWVLYTGHRYGWTPKEVGLSLFAVGLGAAIVQGGIARKLIPAIGEVRALLIGLAIGVAAYAAYGLATQGWMIYTTIAIAAFAGIAQPAAQSLITRSVPSDQQGSIQGALTSLQSLANIAGPVLGSHVFAISISGRLDPPIPGLVYFVCAGLALAGWFVALAAIRRAPLPPTPTPTPTPTTTTRPASDQPAPSSD